MKKVRSNRIWKFPLPKIVCGELPRQQGESPRKPCRDWGVIGEMAAAIFRNSRVYFLILRSINEGTLLSLRH